ncbi:MAG TPA: ATP-binding protein [Casimicrobiaceae bacterium]|nr:ATP-binding protein [Casimicrobiaceae bacterium]
MSGPATPPLAQLTIRADTHETRRASQWLVAAADANRVPADATIRLDHCLDEALANVIAHGGPAATASPIGLHFAVRRNAGACAADLTLLYDGLAFDPSRHEPRPRPANLQDASLGGLGLLMLRHFADALEYDRSDGRNRLTITVNWTEAT